jgi:cysteine desulfuration protein SufE
MINVADQQAQLIEDLGFIEDVQERLSAVVQRYAKVALPPEHKVDAHRVRGCVSSVWLVPSIQDGACHFGFDADSPMVKGLVGLLCEVYQGGAPADVAATEPVLWQQLGFLKQLTPTRQNGLAAVRAAIKDFAEAHASV